MIAKPMGLAALNSFPQRAERMIPFGAGHQAPIAAHAQHAMTSAPSVAPGLHSLAPRFAPPGFKPAQVGPRFRSALKR